jgi:hypothetical protein
MSEPEKDDQIPSDVANLLKVEKFIRPRVERAERAYNQALTSLWVGNAGAALATLTFMGGVWQKEMSPRFLFFPLCLFVAGLISMGIGAAISLLREARALTDMQSARSMWELQPAHFRSGVEQAGLTLDGRTKAALISALCFVIGCVVGLAVLFLHSN